MKRSAARGLAWDPRRAEQGHALAWRRGTDDHVDYGGLDKLRRTHPAWRLLLADSVPLVASFLHRVFALPNVRKMARADQLTGAAIRSIPNG